MSINKKYVMAGMLATSVLMPMADATDSYAQETRTTTANVNFRQGPGTNYTSIRVIPRGQQVTYVSASGSWAQVEYNSETGYIHQDYLTTGDAPSTTSVRYVNARAGLNVRKGPSTSYAKAGKLAHGTQVTVVSTSGGWSKISGGGLTGYVSADYLSSTNPGGSGDDNSNGGSTGDNNQNVIATKYVNASVGLNVRKGPSTGHGVVTKLSHGTEVKVHSVSNGWSEITSGSTRGYVSSQYLNDSNPSTGGGSTESGGEQTQTTMYVNASQGLNVRSGAGTNYSKLGKLSNGTQVTVTSTSNGWSKISGGGLNGYVSSQYLSASKPSIDDNNSSNTDKASKVLNYAKQQLGKPYVWGAQGPSSFDCSGFTYYVFKNSVGINLPRTSSQQSRYGTSVSKSNLQPGDLVFFDTVGSNNGDVTHCGIYMGGGQIIHAASGQGKVVINNFNSSYYQKAFVNAKRVL